MDLKIIMAQNMGNIKKERIILKVVNDCRLSDYGIHDTTYSGDIPSDKGDHFLRLPDSFVSADDIVALYTKKGNYHFEFLDLDKDADFSLRKVHFIYWGRKATIWNKEGDMISLFKIVPIQSKKI